jgi:hypothetical protein
LPLDEPMTRKSKDAPEPDVKVHLTAGCDLCGETGKHTHKQADWRDLIDRSGPFRKGK